ncbi:hypothetical protein HDV00_003032 [Rhizophlyctis rosea]|nr:hypothetical protein HDV00_003032 [Rhizophlyctis rosea]
MRPVLRTSRYALTARVRYPTRTRPFATLAPEFGLFAPSVSSSTASSNPIKSLFDGLVSAVVQEPAQDVSIKKKYEEKLKRAAESEGLSVGELISKRKKTQSTPSRPPTPPPSPNSTRGPSSPPPKPTKPAPERKDGLPSHVKGLNEIMNMDKIIEEDADRIATIWNAYHSAKSSVSGVMPAQFYRDLTTRAKTFPMFILPLPRDSGYEFFLLQFAGHQVFFTPLLEYKTHLENARPHLVLTHYIDLADNKDIVLMSGEVGDQKTLTNSEAQNLVYQMQMFYVTGKEEKKRLVEVFHKEPEKFEYALLIDAVEKLE